MCNRLRAIASARRLCTLLGAKCTVVWEWGNFWHFFAPILDLSIINTNSPKLENCVKILEYRGNRTLDVNETNVQLISSQLFWGNHESPINTRDVVPFLPALHPQLKSLVIDYKAKYLQNTVGFHMRRADNIEAAKLSPDHLFIDYARKLIDRGMKIFLATDNLLTEKQMKQLFGDHVISHPKRRVLRQRWPRTFDRLMAEDDLIDLFLLAETEFVIGCRASSFSSVAIALNGSENCKFLTDLS
jgi:hypothetical protein